MVIRQNVWWRLLRPHTLTASFVPVLIGTALAITDHKFDLPIFLAMLLASILIQSATNMFNEYYDYKRGLDTAESVGIGGAIVRDGISPKTILRLALLFFFIAFLLGIYITLNSSLWISVIGAISMLMGYLYTGGPFPIAYSPFGEIFAGLFMGLVIIEITYFVQTGEITLQSILISIPTSLLISSILTANNIRDLEGDKRSGRKTLVILLGKRRAILFLASLFASAFVWIFALIALNMATIWLSIVVISLPNAIKAVQVFKNNTTPIQMMPAMKATAELNTSFGFLIVIGILLSYFL